MSVTTALLRLLLAGLIPWIYSFSFSHRVSPLKPWINASPGSQKGQKNVRYRNRLLMYDSTSNPPSNKDDPSRGNPEQGTKMWSALAATERWIGETLSRAGSAAAPNSAAASNPYARKEVSYVCEMSDQIESIIGGTFRRLKEMREIGENHVKNEENMSHRQGSKYKPSSLRQTLVVVIPSCKELSLAFDVFDNIVRAINKSRRNANDYFTNVGIELIEQDRNEEVEYWSTSLNLAHLHPQFGFPSSQEDSKKTNEDEGGIDFNLEEYKKKKLMARRSPFPTFVIEVRSSPPFEREEKKPSQRSSSKKKETSQENSVSKADVNKLEALFGKAVTFENEKAGEEITEDKDDEAFYESIGDTSEIQQLSFDSPLIYTQQWVIKNDATFSEKSSFVLCDTKHVDSAFEFFFCNIAAMKCDSLEEQKNYLVMPNFLSMASMSFEKFSIEVQNIANEVPALRKELTVSTFHPEHIDKNKRAPAPILVLQWNQNS